MCASEVTPDGVPDKKMGHRQPHMKLGTMLSRPRVCLLSSNWFDLVERYWELALTFESDRPR